MPGWAMGGRVIRTCLGSFPARLPQQLPHLLRTSASCIAELGPALGHPSLKRLGFVWLLLSAAAGSCCSPCYANELNER